MIGERYVKFTRADFEAALEAAAPGQWQYTGHDGNELEYLVWADAKRQSCVEVRSSVDPVSEVNDGVGLDSIRMFLKASDEHLTSKAASRKVVGTHTARTTNWAETLGRKINDLRALRQQAGDCPKCGQPIRVNVSKRSGGLYARCWSCEEWGGKIDLEAQPFEPFELKGDNDGEVGNTGIGSQVRGGGNEQHELAGDNPTLAPTPGYREGRDRSGDESGEAELSDQPVVVEHRQGQVQAGSGADAGGNLPGVPGGDDRILSEAEPTYEALLDKANNEQRRSVLLPINGAARILAGPGAGKTFTMALRYTHLVREGINPNRILVVTFGAKSSEEMGTRIKRLEPRAEDRYICTIHAACLRLLSEHYGAVPTVAKDWEVKKFLTDRINGREDKGRVVVRALWPDEPRPGWAEVLTWINSAKVKGLSPEADSEYFVGSLGEHASRVDQIRAEFDAWLKSKNFWTFVDMPYRMQRALAEDPDFLTFATSRFSHVLIDEGQDTSGQAMGILRILAGGNLFIVGDQDQLLYRFTGATPEANLTTGFEESYPAGETVMLETNYRSVGRVVDYSNQLIRNNYEQAGGPYPDALLKTLRPRSGAEDGLKFTFTGYDNPTDEAQAIAEEIRASVDAGGSPSDYFLAARTKAQLGYIEGPLTRAGIPYLNIAGGSFWQQAHVVNLVSWLALAHDPGNEKAFIRVYYQASSFFSHPWGVKEGQYCNHRYLGKAFVAAHGAKLDPKALELMEADGRADEMLHTLEAQGSKEAGSKFQEWSYYGDWGAVNNLRFGPMPGAADLYAFTAKLRQILADPEGGSRLVAEYVVDHCLVDWLAADEGLTATDEAENGKVEDLRAVVDLVGEYDSLADFLDHVREMIRQAEAAKRAKDWSGYVVISTVHRLKGLERPVIYGLGWAEGVDADGEPVGLLPHTFSMRPPPQPGVLPTGGMGRVEDERCLGFVCISRAQREVHLSAPAQYRGMNMVPSRFVAELGLLNQENDNG